MTDQESYTGRRRQRTTRKSVVVADHAARAIITVGGIGTVAAVFGVCIFLIAVAAPLFRPAQVSPEGAFPRDTAVAPIHLATDEHARLAWTVDREGVFRAHRLDTGALLMSRPLFEGRELTAWDFSDLEQSAAFGFADGTVQLARIGFTSEFLPRVHAPPFQELAPGAIAEHEDGVVVRAAEGQLRWIRPRLEFAEAIPAEAASPVLLISHIRRGGVETFCALTGDLGIRIGSVRSRRNLMTGEVTQIVDASDLPYVAYGEGAPAFLRLSGLGDNVFLAWDDGRAVRYDVRDYANPRVAEQLDLVPAPGGRLTALEFLIGKNTLIAGDSAGGLRAWFRARAEDAGTSDGARLVAAHDLPHHDAAVTALGVSARGRLFAAGYADGSVGMYHVTSNAKLAFVTPAAPAPALAVALAPRQDAVLSWSESALKHWAFDPAHPEATMAALFRPVWYEGRPGPEHVWQSTGGADDFESKFGLMPLIAGTLKASFYSLLFGMPLALLAAVYTSEFLTPRMRAQIKPTIELMASLPSVVLGFIAALVLAPFIEHWVAETLLVFFTVPMACLIGAQLWQLLPYDLSVRLRRFRIAAVGAMLPAGLGIAVLLGPLFERTLFAGDIKLWLDGQAGTATGGFVLMLLPLGLVASFVIAGGRINEALRAHSGDWSRLRLGVADLLKFIVLAAIGAGTAWALALLLSGLGFDLRGPFYGTYVQRNSLVVGIVMGFAIIPIIYTLAEDALSSVPEHLRAASLGAGATTWQTAMYIVIPTAMSGLFSAGMIGLGRAVGETMIVLMAAGNTPILDFNIFNGFRTLSANIAVELPEAVRNSTHYRTLFLSALTLFAMTFVLNTVAEIVRLRFRKKAFEL